MLEIKLGNLQMLIYQKLPTVNPLHVNINNVFLLKKKITGFPKMGEISEGALVVLQALTRSGQLKTAGFSSPPHPSHPHTHQEDQSWKHRVSQGAAQQIWPPGCPERVSGTPRLLGHTLSSGREGSLVC